MNHIGTLASSPYQADTGQAHAQAQARQSMLTHNATMEGRISGSGMLNSSRTVLSMAVETAVNGYIVIINGERYIAHKPAEITELLMNRLATTHLEG